MPRKRTLRVIPGIGFVTKQIAAFGVHLELSNTTYSALLVAWSLNSDPPRRGQAVHDTERVTAEHPPPLCVVLVGQCAVSVCELRDASKCRL